MNLMILTCGILYSIVAYSWFLYKFGEARILKGKNLISAAVVSLGRAAFFPIDMLWELFAKKR